MCWSFISEWIVCDGVAQGPIMRSHIEGFERNHPIFPSNDANVDAAYADECS